MQLNEIGKNKIRYVDKNYNPYDIKREDFLKIYMKMLELQDPTEPMDVKQMVEMNSQLQQIQFLNNLQQTLQSLAASQQISFISQASALVNKEVVFAENVIDNPLKQYVLLSPEDYGEVQVQLINADSGEVAQTLDLNLQQGLNKLNLQSLGSGNYIVKVYKNGRLLNDITLGSLQKVRYVFLNGNNPMLGTNIEERKLMDILYIGSEEA
jgi:flagellar hook assembly protein FlgD